MSKGSKIMRCDQLARIARRYLGDRYEFEVLPHHPAHDGSDIKAACDTLRDAIVIMLKGTAKLLGPEGMVELRKHTRAICVDYVDSRMQGKYSLYADVHLSPSIAGMAILRRLLREKGSEVPDAIAAHVVHHADPRLEGLQLVPQERPCVAYLGNPSNTVIPDAVASRVHIMRYPSDAQIATAFDQLRRFNMHYAVRTAEQTSHQNPTTTKPFTKGFVAAALGANVIASRMADDVLAYLGPEYPFLVEDEDEASVMRVFEVADAIFGTPAWDRACDRMRYVQSVTSPASVAHQLDLVLSRFA